MFDNLRRWLRGGVLLGGNGVIPVNSSRGESIAGNETIFSAISMLSGAISSLPVSVRQDFRRLSPEEHDVARLLEYGPNPCMTTFRFISCMEVLRDCTGAAYAVKELDRSGGLAALWLMKTENVQPLIDRETRELYYRVRDETSGETAVLHSSLVLAVGHVSTDGITPISPIAVLHASLAYDKSVKEFSVSQMENGSRANIAIRVRGNLTPEQLAKYDAMIGRFKRSGFLYIDDGKEVQELKGANVIDPKVFEVENITIARVARAYNIPLEKFLPERTSYSSAEQSDLNYLRDTILPMARMYEQEFSQKLLSPQDRAAGVQIKFSLNGFARADMATRGEFYMKGVRTGWFCLDDVRSLEDLPPLPDTLGQEFYISKDLISVQAQKTGGAGANVPAAAPGEEIARVSLNGAQISGILQIVQAVASGQMEHGSAITLLISAFPFDETVAEQILGTPGNPTEIREGEEI